MGIGYKDSVIVYNRYVFGTLEKEYYIGTRFDDVRVELTQGANIKSSGLEDADACLVKIPFGVLTKPYSPPETWKNLVTEDMQKFFTLDSAGGDFFVIVHKDEIGVDVDLPDGMVTSSDYSGGFYQYIRDKHGYAYQIRTVDVYQLIPRYEVSGK